MTVTESSLSPIAIALHVLGIAVGVLLGLRAMDALVPDLPAETVDPGVATAAAPGAVLGDDPNSLLLSRNLGPALDQLSEQVPAGEAIVRLRIAPGRLDARTGSGEGAIAPADVAPALPALLVSQIHRRREEVTLADVRTVDLVAAGAARRWYVQLDAGRSDAPPPWTYRAPFGGAPVVPGGSAPPDSP